MPKRVHLSRARGWRMPPNTVKVDRTTRWGNPFVVREGRPRVVRRRWRVELEGVAISTGHSHAEATHRACLRFACEVAPLLDLTALRGKNLACWCKPGDECHADVLLELANQ